MLWFDAIANSIVFKFLFSSCYNIKTIIFLYIASSITFLVDSLCFSPQRFYLFILDRGEGRGKTSMCGCLSCAPYWTPGLQPRHVPWLGIEQATVWFTGWHSIQWATPARADSLCLLMLKILLSTNRDSFTSSFLRFILRLIFWPHGIQLAPLTQQQTMLPIPDLMRKCQYFTIKYNISCTFQTKVILFIPNLIIFTVN